MDKIEDETAQDGSAGSADSDHALHVFKHLIFINIALLTVAVFLFAMFLYYYFVGWAGISTVYHNTTTTVTTYEVSNTYLHRYQLLELFSTYFAFLFSGVIMTLLQRRWILRKLNLRNPGDLRKIIKEKGGLLSL